MGDDRVDEKDISFQKKPEILMPEVFEKLRFLEVTLDFDLTREQEMIRREVRRFAESEIAPVAADLDEKEMFSSELTKKMSEIGLFGMFVSEEYEGQDLDYLSYIIAALRGVHGGKKT